MKLSNKENLALRQNGKQPTKPTITSYFRKYTWNEQYGEGKDFKTREEYFTWPYVTPPTGKSKSICNGLL